MRCPFCAGPFGEAGRGAGEASGAPRYYVCAGCRSLILRPLPERVNNTAFEDGANIARLERADARRTRYFLRRLDWVECAVSRDAPGPRRWCEFGCGSGELLRLAVDRGWTVYGVELSPGLAEAARRKCPGAAIHQGALEDADVMADAVALGAGAFDAVVALDVLEHVRDPETLLCRARERLRPGGILLLQTPNARSLRSRLSGESWNMRIPEYHFHLPSPEGLRAILIRHGFAVLRLTTASGSGTERGPGALLADVKEAALRIGGLGNALVAVARRDDSEAAISSA